MSIPREMRGTKEPMARITIRRSSPVGERRRADERGRGGPTELRGGLQARAKAATGVRDAMRGSYRGDHLVKAVGRRRGREGDGAEPAGRLLVGRRSDDEETREVAQRRSGRRRWDSRGAVGGYGQGESGVGNGRDAVTNEFFNNIALICGSAVVNLGLPRFCIYPRCCCCCCC